MIVEFDGGGRYLLDLTVEEHNALMIIVAGLNDPKVTDVSEVILLILTHCTDRCFSMVKEPMSGGN